MASQSSAVRVLLTNPPFPDGPEKQWNSRGRWGVDWISVETPQAPFIAAYRRNFSVDSAKTIRVHVTADNRYELFLDGKLIGRGSERGDVDNWFFETYDLILEPGEHVLTAKVWTFGDRAAIAQHTLRHGFLLAADHKDDAALVTTSIAPWVGRVLTGITVTPAGEAWGAGGKLDVNGSEFAWDWLEPSGGAWTEVKKVEQAGGLGVNDLSPAHSLRPALLPPMISVTWKNSKVRHAGPCVDGPTSKIAIHAADSVPSEVAAWQHFLEGGKLEIPAHTIRRVLIDHDNYLTAYHHLKTSGGKGSSIRLYWQEALFEKPDAPDKGNRDQIEGKYFTTIWDWTDGIGDIFRPDGGVGREWSSIWWHSGRYVEVLIKTADEPLVLESLRFEETRYPFESQAQFSSSDPRLASVIPIAYRTLQMCSHETYMDCPYYEQLQYVGDTRLQVLVSYVTSPDDRLPRKAMDILGESRLTMGFTQSRYPSHVRQVIPPFSLWWVGMVHDFAMWRGDMDYVLHRMPGVRGVMEAFRSLINEQGLMTAPKGWNFVDWVPGWSNGMAPGTDTGISSILNFHMAMMLRYKAELETHFGEHELASRDIALADRIMKACEVFFDPDHGLYADDLGKTSWSEHAQCMALLEGTTKHSERLIHGLTAKDAPELSRATIYFSHYLFEVFGKIGRTDLMLNRMQLWFDHPANGMKTTIEMPEPTRSDCHAWGAHPIYHYFATVLGIRPVALGMKEVRIAPKLGPLTHAEGTCPTPHGPLTVSVRDGMVGVSVPEGMQAHIGHQVFSAGNHMAPLPK